MGLVARVLTRKDPEYADPRVGLALKADYGVARRGRLGSPTSGMRTASAGSKVEGGGDYFG